jgi:hypothetical protein
MDALLRYTVYQIAFSLLIFEVCLMLFCCVAIIITKLITRWIHKRRVSKQAQIGKIIESYLFDQRPIDTLVIPRGLRQFRNLVETLEKFDQLFSDPRWIEIKEHIIKKCMLSKVKGEASSRFWFSRQLAARCLLLSPRLAEASLLNQLLDDPRYLVRVSAAVCITQTHHKELFYKVIQKMSEETELSRFPYRDALIQVDGEQYRWIEELLKKEKNKEVIAICLDILSARYSGNLLPLIKPYVNDPDANCRKLAIKALGNIPSLEAIQLLMSHLDDPDWNIRAEAIVGLQKLYAIQAIPKLRELLNDPVWWVRLQAGLTLKGFGKEGLEVLATQSKELKPKAFEMAQYTLAIPS